MTILIKGMKMPPSDKALIMAYKDGRFIWIDLDGEKTYQYEAVEVPTPHGRLIDADDLQELYADTDDLDISDYYVNIVVVRQNIKDMLTIIEAEEGQR